MLELIAPAAGVPLYQVVWTRYGVHLALMALLFGRRDGLRLVRPVALGRAVFTSLLMLGMPLCYIWAVRAMPVPAAMGVFWVAPVLVVAFAAARTGDYGGARAVGAVAVGLVGALLICKPGGGLLTRGTPLALGMAACFALYLVMIESMRREAIRTKLFHQALWVFAALTLALPLFWHTPTPRGLAAMTVIGVLGYGGLYALDLALEAAPPAALAPVLYSQLAWDVALRVLLRDHLHGERPDRATALGVLLVLAAAAAVLTAGPRRALAPRASRTSRARAA